MRIEIEVDERLVAFFRRQMTTRRRLLWTALAVCVPVAAPGPITAPLHS